VFGLSLTLPDPAPLIRMYAKEMGLDVERLGIVIPGIAAIIRGYPLGAEPLQLTTFIPNTKETLRLFDFFQSRFTRGADKCLRGRPRAQAKRLIS
jgi:hypothetical protein